MAKTCGIFSFELHSNMLKLRDLHLSKSWRFTCLSVTKTAKSDHPCIRRNIIFVPYSLKGLQIQSDHMGDLIRGWITLPDFGYPRSCQNVSLISNDINLQHNLNSLQPPPEDLLTIFFSQPGVACVEINSRALGTLINIFLASLLKHLMDTH